MPCPCPPSGLGLWIAFAGALGGHAKAVAKAKAYGAAWVAPRAGEGRFRDPHWTPRDARAHVRRYHDAGLRVFPWLFSRPLTWRAELDLFKAFIDEGADGVILDAEAAWDSGQRATAARYMDTFGKELPDVFLADAPWAYPNYHPDFPFEEFALRVNARMPQVYWTEFDNRGAAYHLPRVDAAWDARMKKRPDLVRPILPIGVTYGYEHPSRPPGTFRTSDLELFLNRYGDRPAVSLYTLEAARTDARITLLARAKAKAGAASPIA